MFVLGIWHTDRFPSKFVSVRVPSLIICCILQRKALLITIIKFQKRAGTFFWHSTVTWTGSKTQWISLSTEYILMGALDSKSLLFVAATDSNTEPLEAEKTVCIPCSITWRKQDLGMGVGWEMVPESSNERLKKKLGAEWDIALFPSLTKALCPIQSGAGQREQSNSSSSRECLRPCWSECGSQTSSMGFVQIQKLRSHPRAVESEYGVHMIYRWFVHTVKLEMKLSSSTPLAKIDSLGCILQCPGPMASQDTEYFPDVH